MVLCASLHRVWHSAKNGGLNLDRAVLSFAFTATPRPAQPDCRFHEVYVADDLDGRSSARSRLEQAIVELVRLDEVLLSGDLEPLILADFRDALNRVRTSARAAQQYVIRRDVDQDSSSVLSLLVGERIRAAYQLCEAIGEDLKRTDVEFQAGSLVQLYDVLKALTEQLNDVINRRG